MGYTAAVIISGKEEVREAIRQHLVDQGIIQEKIEEKWPEVNPLCHHMTINMGSFKQEMNPTLSLGAELSLIPNSIAFDNKVVAIGVSCEGVATINDETSRKHVTVAVNRMNGGKPFSSNKLTDWQPFTASAMKAIVQEEG